jgi:hypothetical protein
MDDKNADKRNAIMLAETAVAEADHDLRNAPEWQAYMTAQAAMIATSAYTLRTKREVALDELYDEHGEPVGYCEGCSVPFFEDDPYAHDPDEVIFCCREDGPCFAPPEKEARER